jgi:hypothetical protein
LLAAASEVVPFGFRNAELTALASWRDDAQVGLAARLLHGPGGQGKTRLAARFAADSAAAGWAAARARHYTDRGSTGVLLGPVGDSRGLLLVVDYAERCPADDLLDLLSGPLMRQEVPTRVLLLARPVGWWWTLTHRLGQLGITADETFLPPLAADPATRVAAFTAASARFAAPDLYDLAGGGDNLAPPRGLDLDEAYRQVLVIHMAALAAVDAAGRGDIAPQDPGELSAYLIGREREHWRLLHAQNSYCGHATSPHVMARVVYTATLTRPQPYDAAIALLGRAGIAGNTEAADQVLNDHAFCYPPAQAGTVLEPLYPDRLGEDFLALTTPGHQGATGADPWAPGPATTTPRRRRSVRPAPPDRPARTTRPCGHPPTPEDRLALLDPQPPHRPDPVRPAMGTHRR